VLEPDELRQSLSKFVDSYARTVKQMAGVPVNRMINVAPKSFNEPTIAVHDGTTFVVGWLLPEIDLDPILHLQQFSLGKTAGMRHGRVPLEIIPHFKNVPSGFTAVSVAIDANVQLFLE
jgi:hypothetical protein